MIKFLILILVAFIVFPIVIISVKKIDLKTKLMFLFGGFIIALLGLLAQSKLSLYYSVLIMLGLLFAGAVIITKRLENEKLQEEELHLYVPKSIQEAIEKPSESYVAATSPTPKVQPVIESQAEDWLKPSKKEDQ
ncbi:hypothetical protein HMPREF1210_00262 [Paenisporosarcina sp. HGH0030]|uniref:hypothetical protein n=1 Tax=Paenisporosarcina sp. HGH0030 TaxID=1078085 RepID=UPI00034E8962|nr:hypothetical protein [Paenisporosarcina sp. HGH0030]EPD54276.1 hypothetical protein HMPREF1210_00262 [Paenisporosarcina sp. HGH0030]